MVSPTLEFDVLRGDSLTPEATVVASGIGVNPNAATGVLSPGESLETIWLKRIIPQRTLTSIAKYQVAFIYGRYQQNLASNHGFLLCWRASDQAETIRSHD